jgi:alginate O-acetyltransferase complex protein AlgI
MLFSSYTYILIFFPAVLLLFFLTPSRAKPYVVLLASACFYIFGTPVGFIVVLISSLIDYSLVQVMPGRSFRERTLLFQFAIFLNLSVLVYMKYSNFLIGETNRILLLIGLSPIESMPIVYPIGISFIVFHKISYLVEIYRGKSLPGRLLDYMNYILFFPKLLMGPITKYNDFDLKSFKKEDGFDNIYLGLARFCRGLAKKVLIADTLAFTANKAFGLQATALTPELAWIGAICFTFQIYFDFSGYTDMALGTARILGVRLPENFNQPYLAGSFVEFWRRWHITLSQWFRDYVYIPLGGNRGTAFSTYRNLWIVFLLSGLWHGAGWNFIAWGAFHGAFITLDKLGWQGCFGRLRGYVSVPVTFGLLLISWVLFRADGLGHAFYYLKAMFFLGAAEPTTMLFANLIDNRGVSILCVAAVFSFVSMGRTVSVIDNVLKSSGMKEALSAAFYLLLFVLSVIVAANNSYAPFIYLEF